MTTLHGECKLPGGKLVVVDLVVLDQRIAELRVSGDFFVHPESQSKIVLEQIASQVIELPSESSRAALAARIESAVPATVELLGTNPEAIATAILRAIHANPMESPPGQERIGSFTPEEIAARTQAWKQIPWRLIPEREESPAMNVALDEVLTRRVGANLREPTLRFWRWSKPAVIIGRTQAVRNEVDLEAVQEMKLDLVRRITGGGAMFLQPHGAITYSLYMPADLLQGMSIRQSYEVCESWIIKALRDLGVDAHHVPINDIACSLGKIGGAAQARWPTVILHHTTIAYEMDPNEMMRVLRIGREKISDKPAISSAARRVSPLLQQTQLEREAIVAHLFTSFHRQFGGTLDRIHPEEYDEAKRLVDEKYGTGSWTFDFE